MKNQLHTTYLFRGFGLDLDTHSIDKLFTTYLKLQYIKPKRIEIYRTKRGYHIYVYTQRPLLPHENLTLRYYFGDDPGRIFYDEHFRPVHWWDTFFKIKINMRTGEVSREEKLTHLPHPWWISRLPRGYYVNINCKRKTRTNV